MFQLNVFKLLKFAAVSLLAGFAFLLFVAMFASILSFSLQATDWYTAENLVGIITAMVVIGLGVFYVRSQRRVQNPASKPLLLKKLARNLGLTVLIGLIITILFTPLFQFTFDPTSFGMAGLLSGHISGLLYITVDFLSALASGPFPFYFGVSFVVIFLFDSLRTRASSNYSLPPKLRVPSNGS